MTFTSHLSKMIAASKLNSVSNYQLSCGVEASTPHTDFSPSSFGKFFHFHKTCINPPFAPCKRKSFPPEKYDDITFTKTRKHEMPTSRQLTVPSCKKKTKCYAKSRNVAIYTMVG